MSLRSQINLLISILFAFILLSGSIFVISNARSSINNEILSTAKLTLQLIEIAYANAEQVSNIDVQKNVLEQIANMEGTRHLEIVLHRAINPDRRIPTQAESPISSDAPKWFIQLVKPPPVEFRKVFTNPGHYYTEIIIKANPSDEITEVWNETKGILILLFLFAVLTNILIYITLGRGLAPIETILDGLGRIEQGDYLLRLPKFSLTELSRISDKFNHMASVLQKSRDENKLLTQRSLAIQEDERRHLAQELHDELGQTITAIKAVAVAIEKQVDTDEVKIIDNARTIVDYSNHIYDVAHQMMGRLRPAILYELGLVKALQSIIDEWNDRQANIFCHSSFDGELDNFDEEVNITIYRIVQEALTNIIKHANATDISIDLKRDNKLYLLIKDNGVGFELNDINPGLGLLGMKERVEALDGAFNIETGKGLGVIIKIMIPIKK